jgi:hypothetical protein
MRRAANSVAPGMTAVGHPATTRLELDEPVADQAAVDRGAGGRLGQFPAFVLARYFDAEEIGGALDDLHEVVHSAWEHTVK